MLPSLFAPRSPRGPAPAAAPRRALTYMAQLDGLRALAVLAVLWTHYLPQEYWLFGVYWGGYGVRLFFVLSGFLITTILLHCRRSVHQGQQRWSVVLRRFYYRRFLRLCPLYYATLAVTALLNIAPVRETLAWHLSYLSNVYFALRGAFHGPVAHLWSLAVEEQFYLVWPWLIFFVPERWLLATFCLCIGAAPLFRLLGTLVGLNPVALWVLTPSFLDMLCLGALLAYLRTPQAAPSGTEKTIRTIFLVTGVPLTVVCQLAPHIGANSGSVALVGDTAKGLVFAWLVATAAEGFPGVVGKILASPPLVYLGKISYGIYLLHPFMATLALTILHAWGLANAPSDLALAVVATVATLLVATASWQVFEKPLNDLKRFFPYGP